MTRTPTETRSYIATHGEASRALQFLGDLAKRDPHMLIDIAHAVRNCPLAVAAAGRVLANGVRKHGALGPSADQTWGDHHAAAMRHITYAAHGEMTDAETGESSHAHAAARCLLAVELVEGK